MQIILIWHPLRLWLAYLLNAFVGFSKYCLSARQRRSSNRILRLRRSENKMKTFLSDSRFEIPEPSCRKIDFETQMIQTGRSISDTTTYVICKFQRYWKIKGLNFTFSQLAKKFCVSDHRVLAEKSHRRISSGSRVLSEKPIEVVHRKSSHSLFLLQILAFHNITSALS